MGKFIDITGQRFGRLTVISRSSKTNSAGQVHWNCICDCGNECIVSGTSLRNGHTKSCGCYNAESRIKNGKKHLINRIGQTYGKLTVIAQADNQSYGTTGQQKSAWICQCECGNICIVTGDALQSGKTKSCGCLRSSLGEYKVEKLLKQLNLPYEREKIFTSCKFPSGKYARFDFYVNNSYLIEFDGKQHFLPEAGWGENFEDIQYRDDFKNQWCKKNKIPLIRISYLYENDFTKEDLVLETTKYRYI